MRKVLLLTLLLCGFMQASAQTWTDDNGFSWSFSVNGTEATDIKFLGGPDSQKIYLFGGPDNETPAVLGPADAAAGRFSDYEGLYFPFIPDDVYFGNKTLVFDIIAAEEGQFIWGTGVGCTCRVMNGWWSSIYADDVPLSVGLWELPITEAMATECARGGQGKDLDILMTRGSITVKSVYYESSEVSGAVVIPEKVYVGSTELTVTSIGNNAFYGCSGITSVTIPETVTSIGECAFVGCTGLTSMTIGESVTSIGNYAFAVCYGLTSVTFPSTVTSIGDGVLNGCENVQDIYCYAVSCPSVYDNTFFSYSPTLHVPEASLQQYKDHSVWGLFFEIVPIDESSAINEIGIEGVASEIEAIYDGNGQRQPALRRGINIIKMTDGTIKKVLVK